MGHAVIESPGRGIPRQAQQRKRKQTRFTGEFVDRLISV